MDRELNQHAEEYNKRHHKKKLWAKVIGILGCAVVFCTTYALILPAATLEGPVYCGMEEHQHDEQCFERVLVCSETEAEPGHIHTEACYETVKTYICGIEEEDDLSHTHTDDCYIVTEALQCGMEEGYETETSTHIHTDECYEETLICQLPEHTHDESCRFEMTADGEAGQVSSDEKTPVAETSEKETPSEEISGEEAPLEEISGEEAPTEDVPDGEVPAEENPVALPDDARAFADLVPAQADSPLRAPSMTPAMLAEAGEADGEQAGGQTGSLDFTNWITGVEVKYWNGEKYVTLPEDRPVTPEDDLRFVINYTVPRGKLSAQNNTIHYKLPDGVKPDEKLTGTVYSASGAVVGTYIIAANGEISITFSDTYVKQNQTLDIEGSIGIDSDLDEELFDKGGHVDLEFKDKVNVGFEIEKKDDGHSDLEVTKSADETKVDDDGTVSYTIKVKSVNGTSAPVHLEDIMSNVKLDGGISGITVEGADAGSYTVTETANGFTIDLPPMAPEGEYTITYTGKLPESVVATITAKNEVDVTSRDKDGGELKKHTDVKTEVKQNYVGKKGELDKDKDTITWTITVNPGGKNDVAGWELTDTFNGGALTYPVTITDADGNVIEENVTLPYTFPAGADGGENHNTYTVTYETPADPALGEWGQATNETELTPPGDPDDPDPGASTGDKVNTGKGDYNPLSKKGEFKKDENGTIATSGENGRKTATIEWTVTIDATLGDVPAPWTFEDKLRNDQSFTDQQIKDLKSTLGAVLAEAGFGESEYTIKPLGSKGYTIEFKKTLKQGTKITFTYETTAVLGDGNHAITFENKANINEKVEVVGKTQYNPSELQVKKEDQNGDKEHGYYELATGHGGAPGVLSWLITVTLPGDYDGGALTMKEYLPEGLDLYYLEILADGVDNFGARKITEIKTHEIKVWNGSYDDVYEVDVSKGQDEDGQQFIKVVIPENLAENKNLKEIRFVVRGKIRDDFDWPKDADGNYLVVSFDNKVEIESEDTKHHGGDEQTQKIKDDYSKNVLKKVHGQALNGNRFDDNQVPYTITVNPEGRDLLKGTDELHLIDELEYRVDDGAAWSASLVPGSVHVYRMEKGGLKGEEIKDFSYTYTEKDNGDQYYLRQVRELDIVIPDETPLIVEYRYKVFGKEGLENRLNNEVSLEGYSTDGDNNKDGTNFHVVGSNATANTKGVTIYKMEAGNDGKALRDAKFNLFQWDGTENGYRGITDPTTGELITYITNTDGMLTLNDLAPNTAYKLVEIEAPEGYLLSDQPCFFWIVNEEDQDSGWMMPKDFKDYAKRCIPDQPIHYPNTPEKTSIEVEKKWLDAAGNSTEAGAESVIVDLYQVASTTPPVESGGAEIGNGVSLEVSSWGTLYDWWPELKTVPVGTEVQLIITNQNASGDGIAGGYDFYANFDVLVDGERVEPIREMVDNSAGRYFYTFTVKQNAQIKVKVEWSPMEQIGHEFKIVSPVPVETDSPAAEPLKPCATVTLNAGNWKHTFNDLPRVKLDKNGKVEYYYTYYVVEKTVQNYETTYEYGGTETTGKSPAIVSGKITINNKRTNTPSYELPEAGGPGTLWYTIGGLSLIAGALMYELLWRKRGSAHN